MIESGRAGEILKEALGVCRADGVEASLAAEDSALTRFADGRIHQNVSREDALLSVRARAGRRMGESETRSLSLVAYAQMATESLELARSAPDEPDLLPLVGPSEFEPSEGFDPAATLSAHRPEARAAAVREAFGIARAAGLSASGAYEQSVNSFAIQNSTGLSAFHRGSRCRFVMTATGETSTGWAESSAFGPGGIDPAAVARRAVGKATLGKDPRALSPGAYDVILEPAAVAGLLQFLGFGFDRLAVEEGRSFLSGGRHRRIGGPGTTLRADFSHPLHRGAPFDGEGVPRRRLSLIEKGDVREFFCDRRTALRLGVPPTGHSPGGRSAYGALPDHLVLEGGTDTIESLVRSTDKGLLLTRTWYENWLDPMACSITGMTRDGVLLVEKGEIAGGVKNFRFNESVLEALARVDGATAPAYAEGIVCPALRIRDFHFTEATDF